MFNNAVTQAHDWVELTMAHAMTLAINKRGELSKAARLALVCPSCKNRHKRNGQRPKHLIRFLSTVRIHCNGIHLKYTAKFQHSAAKPSSIYVQPTLEPINKLAAMVITSAPKV